MRPAPSSEAAYSISLGTSARKDCIIQTAMGKVHGGVEHDEVADLVEQPV